MLKEEGPEAPVEERDSALGSATVAAATPPLTSDQVSSNAVAQTQQLRAELMIKCLNGTAIATNALVVLS